MVVHSSPLSARPEAPKEQGERAAAVARERRDGVAILSVIAVSQLAWWTLLGFVVLRLVA